MIEIVIGIAFLASVFLALTVSLEASRLLKRTRHTALATQLAESAIEALRDLPFPNLTNRTDGSLLNFPFNIGGANTVLDNSAPSPNNALDLTSATSSIDEISGLLLAPQWGFTTSTIDTNFKTMNDSPANWQAGLVFGYQDTLNHYRVRLQSNELAIEKVLNGAVTTLSNRPVALSKDTWYSLSLTATSTNSFSALLNGLDAGSATDGQFSKGALGLALWNKAHVHFDNLNISSELENFDATAAGALPAGWRRYGPENLPEGKAFLTISDWGSLQNVKQVSVRIEWKEMLVPRSVTVTSLVSAF